jgi:hypothetical protein
MEECILEECILEECIICFEETDKNNFVMFECNHKVCVNCYPILIETTSRCPNCDIQLNIYPKVEIHECNICKYTNRTLCFVIILIIFIFIYNNNIHG